MQHFPFIAERINQVLDKIEIQGVLEGLQLSAQFNENQLTKYAYKSTLQNANISISEQGFAVTSIIGEVVGNHQQGSLELDCDAMGVKIDKIFAQPLENQNIKGVVNWQYGDENILITMQEMSVESNEMTANLQGSLQIIDTKPYVDIQIGIPYVKAETLKQYFPYKRMKPKLSKWLSESITAGTLKDGKLLIHGNPEKFSI